ncbi:MAG: TonB-dependent receptor plug domain-containing protein, partial [Sphingobacteriaceae bacterium]|nr:TonB-dependent receptor plug domain-containing protein [Cytophagaceae bacterium]
MKKRVSPRDIGWELMKASLLQLLLAAIYATASFATDGQAQEVLQRKITVQAADKNVSAVLIRIERAAQVKFSYSPNLIGAGRRVNLSALNESLADVLSRLLNPLNLGYQVVGNQIILTRNPATPDVRPESQAVPNAETAVPVFPVTGRVTDEAGAAIPGATVRLRGTDNVGTTTNAEGRFSLNLPDGMGTLVISSVGYVAQELAVGNQSTLNVSLKTDTQSLNEVVVIGYGAVKKRDLTGSVASIGTDELKAQPISSFNQALQGRVAGVQVTNASNAPGGGVTIRVRGGNSISASNDPLYVIDGFPITNPSPATGAAGSASFPNPLASINPNDIESIEILKDASATAI